MPRPCDEAILRLFLWGDVQTVIKDADYVVDPQDGILVPFTVNETYEEFAYISSHSDSSQGYYNPH